MSERLTVTVEEGFIFGVYLGAPDGTYELVPVGETADRFDTHARIAALRIPHLDDDEPSVAAFKTGHNQGVEAAMAILEERA